MIKDIPTVGSWERYAGDAWKRISISHLWSPGVESTVRLGQCQNIQQKC